MCLHIFVVLLLLVIMVTLAFIEMLIFNHENAKSIDNGNGSNKKVILFSFGSMLFVILVCNFLTCYNSQLDFKNAIQCQSR